MFGGVKIGGLKHCRGGCEERSPRRKRREERKRMVRKVGQEEDEEGER